MRVVFACDNRVELGLVGAVHSLLVTHRDEKDLEVHVVHTGLSPRVRAWLERRLAQETATLVLHEYSLLLDSFEQKGSHVTSATMLRLLLPEILPESVKRVIYMDTDVQVATSIRELWQAPLKDVSTGAVQSYLFPTFELASLSQASRRVSGFTGPTPYLNAGVLVMDLHRWRQDGIGRRAMEAYNRHHVCMNMYDQDALNLVLNGAWEAVDLRWNVQMFPIRHPELWQGPIVEELRARHQELLETPGIVHFTGRGKPWEMTDFRNPRRGNYLRMLKTAGYLSRAERCRRTASLVSAVAQRSLHKLLPVSGK